MKNLTKEEVATMFEGGNHAVNQHVLRTGAVNSTLQLMKITPIPAYFGVGWAKSESGRCTGRKKAHGFTRRIHHENLCVNLPTHLYDRKLGSQVNVMLYRSDD